MQMHRLRLRAFAFVAGVAIMAFSGWVAADPPSRVARLGYMTGAVSYSPAGENDWVRAAINRPLTTGDRLWADAGSRAEIQIGGAVIRMSAGTGVSVLNLDDRITQLQLTQGTLSVRVRHLEPDQAFEVDTPNLAFTLRQPGEYRITVDPDGSATTIVVRKGQGEVYGEGAAYVVDSRQPYRFTGTGLSEYQYVEAPRQDEFDRWSSDRDRIYDSSVSARYVSQDVVGYQDLDANGTWRADATYGNVWTPNRVAAGWAPYRDGHWAWVDPWGWTWVDDAPWGFAVSHYGRWANLGGTWGWIPGPVRTRAYYAPALVVFVGGSNFQLAISGGNVGGVAWFPLGPREVYRPSYAVSRGYFENVNTSNTIVNNTVINNYYNNTNVTNVVYANRQVPGAVVAVPTTAFVQSQPVSKAAVRVTREMVASAPLAVVAPVAPTERSVRGAAAPGDKPPARTFERPVVARTAPPAPHAGFAAQQPQLSARPGQPLDEGARKELKPAEATPAPVVKVVTQTEKAPPTMRPPAAAPGTRPVDARGTPDERKAAAAPMIPGAPGAPTQVGAPSQAASPAPVARPPEQRGKAEQPAKGEQRAQPVAPPAPESQRAAEPKPGPRQVPPPAPVVQPPEQRTAEPKPGPRQVPPPAPVVQPPEQRAAEPKPGPRQVPPPAPVAQPPEQRAAEPRTARRPAPSPAPMTQPPEQRAAEPKAATRPVPPPAPMPQPPDQRGAVEQPRKGEQRGQPVAPPPPPQRAAEPRAAPPQAAPPAAATQPPVQRSAQPPQAAPAPKAGTRGEEARPAEGKPDKKQKDADDAKREDEGRKPKG